MSCGRAAEQREKRIVTVSIEPLRYFVEKIGGDRFEVNTMVPTGGNPETYEPTAQQLVSLNESKLYVKVGSIGFERIWMDRIRNNAPNTLIVNASEGIVPVKDAHGDEDPHTWMSCKNATVIAQNIYRALKEADAEDSTLFKKNLDSLLTIIEAVDLHTKASLGGARKTFLVYHPILTYFARDYGLNQISVEREGREPSAADLKATISEARKLGAKVFLVQQEFANRNVEIVARGTGAETKVINPLGYDWQTAMLDIVNLLK